MLKSISDDGGRDFSLAEVGRRLDPLGGPKTQSLRNAQGASYREIISAYASAVNGSTRYIAKNNSSVENALALITDPSIRAVLRIALDDAKKLKIVNDNLHSAFKNISIGTSLPQVASPPKHSELPSMGVTMPELSPRLITALKKGIDEKRLRQQGLAVSDDGGVENEFGDKVFPPAFVTAIRAILESDVNR